MASNNHPDLPDILMQSSAFRGNDIYHPDMDGKQLLLDFYPANVTELIQVLSNITSGFYGNMLKQIGLLYGMDHIDQVSTNTVYELGKAIAQRCLVQQPDMEKNAQGITKTSLVAIFTGNPEYQFEILEYTPGKVVMLVKGVDRYHRIALAMGIEKHITWPVVAVFIRAINDEMGLNYTVDLNVKQLNASSQCLYEVTIKESAPRH
ncbi:hypothetical protein ACVBEF_07290 [Glaciimonas sp. GG7]